MDKRFLADRPGQLWNELQQLVATRAKAESAVAARYAEEKAQIEREFQEAKASADQAHETTREDLDSKYIASRKAVVQRYSSEHDSLKQEHQRVSAEAKTLYKKVSTDQKQKLKDARWEAHTVFEATKDEPRQRLAVVKKQVAKQLANVEGVKQQADQLIEQRWQKSDSFGVADLEPSDWVTDSEEAGEPKERFVALLQDVEEQWAELVDQRIPRLFEGGQLYLLIPVAFLISAVPFGLILGWSNLIWMLLGAIFGTAIWGGLVAWLYRLAHQQTGEAYLPLCQTLLDVKQAAEKTIEAAKITCKQEEEAIAERLRTELEKAEQEYARITEQSRLHHDSKLEHAETHYPPRLTDVIVQRENELDLLETAHVLQMEQFEQEYRDATEKRQAQYAKDIEDLEKRHKEAWEAMAERWRTGMQQVEEEVDQLTQTERELFFDWHAEEASQWKSVDHTPHAIPFGHVTIDLAKLEGGIPEDERLKTERTKFVLPALFPFPDQSLLFTATGEGRQKAVETIQAVMLRLLTGNHPGKVRFTVMDPVGLGESFSAFMHLADYDEQVISSRIWTESSHIEQQLVKLTEHMENVIQVYLRNEFETIQQYNDYAGEMAEPYRVLVVANFPTNFTESAARRLLSIVSSGARCGVYVLLSVDRRMPMPHGFELSELEPMMLHLDWQEGYEKVLRKDWHEDHEQEDDESEEREEEAQAKPPEEQKPHFAWEASSLAEVPLDLETPPEPKKFTELVRAVGEEVLEGDRVEVPFEFVVPKQEEWWDGDSGRELDIPLGRAGAMKLQHLNLGRGTAQHVLVAGKTGSGKSNLMHAIITNAALWYSPDQVELYLVDFKKGVEFKPYAEHHLPHAKVIAVESEREFGLSVLERLDVELKERGDRFRQVGVQDMAGWRRQRPDEKMPRVVLVIDEFQELFVEDDRIAQNAAQLLDRLVRQGRAFGMHVLLGSQTLAGAYSLPRATIGQMAVRIALQCSESDAHLILSEENTAARLLTRPGEAIYNDANGLYEGNHPFQVVWLPDHDRTHYLKLLDDWAKSHDCRPAPPIVFEGNAAADPRKNHLLEAMLNETEPPKPGRPVRAWLGEAVAIKEPTSVVFGRQGGSNLLLVGHAEESALGIMTTSLLCLAAQTPATTGRGSLEEAVSKKEPAPQEYPPAVQTDTLASFYILDGTRPDSHNVGLWARFSKTLPQKVSVGDPRNTAATLNAIMVELSRRQDQELDSEPPVYLVVHDLGRFRDLRREEDSFRFSSMDDDAPVKPSVQFTKILREGPSFGIHTLVWCDTCNTLGRWLDRQSTHDFEMRIAFQMSGADSSTLIDSAEAARLGNHRAIYYNEGLGQIEKFRPYGMPEAEWLAQVQSQLLAKL